MSHRAVDFDAILPTLGLSHDAGAPDAYEATIVPQSQLAPLASRPTAAASATLPEGFGAWLGTRGEVDFTTLDTLGQGGMGIVYLADQRSLRREVAVKRIRPERQSPETTAELLREAWLMGSLEHPNIPPVHTLAWDGDSPVLVMKRIEGTAWRALLRGEERRELAWHLRVLVQVCHAVHYAHSRGIVHRDIKPDNVMIGAFGEVYLLDWGIAVSLREADRGRVVLAREAAGLAGTPAYLAPEMLTGEPVDERTDVYLLGATLHELITGAPPHLGESLIEVLRSAFVSAPAPYPPSVPEELAAICQRAMSVERSARFADVAALQRALEDFLEHRESARLAASARERLDALEARIAALGEGAAADEDALEAVAHAFAECRYGFEQALGTWPDNPVARRGLRRALEVMAHHEIAQGDLRAARRLFGELSERLQGSHSAEMPPELLEGLRLLRERELAMRENLARLEALDRELDPTAADRFRSQVALMVAGVCVAPGVLLSALEALGWVSFGYATTLGLIGAGLVESLLGVWIFRRRLILNAMSRRMAAFFVVLLGLIFIGHLNGLVRGLEAVDSLVGLPLVAAAGLAAAAIMVDRRMMPLFVLYVVSAVASNALRTGEPLVLALTHLVACGMLVWIWGRSAARRRDAASSASSAPSASSASSASSG